MTTRTLDSRENALLALTRPIWDSRLRSGLVGFGIGAVLGAALPWGVALVVVPVTMWGLSLAVERVWSAVTP